MQPNEILAEALTALPLAEAGRDVGVCEMTIRRWISAGIRGVRLKSLRVGGRRRVTKQQLAEFLAATSGTAA